MDQNTDPRDIQYVKIKVLFSILIDILGSSLTDKLSILSSMAFDAYLEGNVSPEIVESCWTHFIKDYKHRYNDKNQKKAT